MKAEPFQSANSAASDGLSVAFVEIGIAEVVKGLLAGNQVVAGEEQTVADGYSRTLFAAAGRETRILGLK